jgi:phosphatidylglycerol:prolipoprotein diacylglycerol transferase
MIYPEINPVAMDLGVVKIYWYGLLYLLAFLSAYKLAGYRASQGNSWTKYDVEDLIFFGVIGVIVGGRFGYQLFYNLSGFLAEPLSIFAIQGGGMSFHGGLIGVGLGMLWFARKYKKSFLQITDFAIPLVPLGLLFGRIGNFINGELWGAETTSTLGMWVAEKNAYLHASQLYEAFLEGVILFVVIWIFSNKDRRVGSITGLFLLLYGVFRFAVEFVRMPDQHIGYIAFDWLTMGQLLCIPMIVLGMYLYIKKSSSASS